MSSFLLMILPYFWLSIARKLLLHYSNSKLLKVQDWAYQWKMFDLELAKEVEEVIFWRNSHKITHSPLYFNNATFKLAHTQRHVALQLDRKLWFNKHANNKKSYRVSSELQPILSHRRLLINYRSFIRPHLDYSDVTYDQDSNASYSNKIELVQYDVALTGAIKGSSRDKLYQELGLEYFQQRKRIRRLCLLYRFLSAEQTSHIHNLFPHIFTDAQTLSTYLLVEMNTSKIHFFPQVSNERNKFDTNIRRSINYDIFCNALLKLLRSFKKKIFSINDPLRKENLIRLRLGFTNLDALFLWF